MITATRYHDISAGHRVYGHESKCAHMHGHNYRFHFTVVAKKIDKVGRVMDFSVIKTLLCEWLEENWDHKFLLWALDPLVPTLAIIDYDSLVPVPFNPTAEGMAEYMLNVVGPNQLAGTGVTLIKVVVEETAKCSATAELRT